MSKGKIGDNSVEGGQLKALVERIERAEIDIKELNDEKADIYAEARGNGFDVKILRKVIALRRKDKQARWEESELIDAYMSAIGDL